MVCGICRIAGEINREAVVRHPEGTPAQKLKFELAAKGHEACDGCDCAHKVGFWVTPAPIVIGS